MGYRATASVSELAETGNSGTTFLLRRIDVQDAALRMWLADIGDGETCVEGCWQLLSADERARAERYRCGDDRRGFVKRRALLRKLIGAELGTAPAKVKFAYSNYGKPALVNNQRLRFNLSYAKNCCLIAISDGLEVGVDIEHLDTTGELWRLARHFLSSRETDALQRLGNARREAAFLNVWTRKEAVAKARGRGLSMKFSELQVPSGPLCASYEDARWILYSVPAGSGYVASAAVWR